MRRKDIIPEPSQHLVRMCVRALLWAHVNLKMRMGNMDEVLEFLKSVSTYYLATVEDDQPRVRAFGTIHKFEDRLYIQTGRVKDVYKQLKANPKAEICAFDGKRWLRVAATFVEDERIEAEQSMLEAYPSLAGRYQPGDGNNTVFYMKDVTATFDDFSPELKTVITF